MATNHYDNGEPWVVVIRGITIREFDLCVSVWLLTEDGSDEIDAIMDFEDDDAFEQAIAWCERNGYKWTLPGRFVLQD